MKKINYYLVFAGILVSVFVFVRLIDFTQAQTTNSCSFDSITVPHNSSFIAYRRNVANSYSECGTGWVGCYNGVLTDTTRNKSLCAVKATAGTVNGTSCTWNGRTIPHYHSFKAYKYSTRSSATDCENNSKWIGCYGGTISDTTYPYSVCSVRPETTNNTPTNTTTTYSWRTGEWGTCSNSTQTRSVDCTDNTGATFQDYYCTSSKPAVTQACLDANAPVFESCYYNGGQIQHRQTIEHVIPTNNPNFPWRLRMTCENRQWYFAQPASESERRYDMCMLYYRNPNFSGLRELFGCNQNGSLYGGQAATNAGVRPNFGSTSTVINLYVNTKATSPSQGRCFSYVVDWGDGTIFSVPEVNPCPANQYVDGGIHTHTYAAAGKYTVTVKVFNFTPYSITKNVWIK